MDLDEERPTMKQMMEKIQKLEEKVKELERLQKILHEAVFKMYEDQRRRERVL
jgi:hypothetical protein